ncbi:cupin domain-containing protein [Methylacidiphilum sp. Yel]|uniref:cupin domain-containing protein n=1 Tax=Methylacidiphilum sp. Yel TaxID=1847730 RepID=UPI00106DCF16|nr:cupin domain-containing protein [Methylacidiphilum sp. Yel]
MEILIEKNPTQQRLKELGVSHWPIWEKDVSKFDWQYPEKESCYLLEGEAIIYHPSP